jgi:hypothetical protein
VPSGTFINASSLTAIVHYQGNICLAVYQLPSQSRRFLSQ